MKTTIQFNLAPKFLKALTPFMSKDETRYILNGIHLTATENRVLLVATDGRRMGIMNITDEIEWTGGRGQILSAIIPADTLRAMPRPIGSLSKIAVEITADDADGAVKFTGRTTISSRLIGGHYPKWDQVVPRTPSTAMPSLDVNAGLLNDFVTASKTLGGESIRLTQHGANGTFIIRMNTPAFLGVLMPVRIETTDTLPAWLAAA